MSENALYIYIFIFTNFLSTSCIFECLHDFDHWPSKGSYPTISSWLSLLALQPKSLCNPGMGDLSVNPRWPAYPCPSPKNMTANTHDEGKPQLVHIRGSCSELFTEQVFERCFWNALQNFGSHCIARPDTLRNFVYKCKVLWSVELHCKKNIGYSWDEIKVNRWGKTR